MQTTIVIIAAAISSHEQPFLYLQPHSDIPYARTLSDFFELVPGEDHSRIELYDPAPVDPGRP